MVKYFCDICGEEIHSYNSISDGRLKTSWKKPFSKFTTEIMVEVMTGKDRTMNSGHFCRYCVIDAVKSLDDRPQAG